MDNNSSEGTFVNGTEVKGQDEITLFGGDILGLGDYKLEVRISEKIKKPVEEPIVSKKNSIFGNISKFLRR